MKKIIKNVKKKLEIKKAVINSFIELIIVFLFVKDCIIKVIYEKLYINDIKIIHKLYKSSPFLYGLFLYGKYGTK